MHSEFWPAPETDQLQLGRPSGMDALTHASVHNGLTVAAGHVDHVSTAHEMAVKNRSQSVTH